MRAAVNMGPPSVTIARASGDTLLDTEGRGYLDLFSANGTAWLGHAPPAVAQAITAQLQRAWTTGALPTAQLLDARRALDGWFPAGFATLGLYSTGAEVTEVALRLARQATGRGGAAGFHRAMHGKTLAPSVLSWENPGAPGVDGYHRLAFLPERAEDEVLAQVARLLADRKVGALLVEPWHASGGGHRASDEFYRRLETCCRQTGTYLVFDELLTGLYRTGPRFAFEGLGITPDLVLVGKGLGSGFPVAALVGRAGMELTPPMLPGSTFSGNALAAAAVVATLEALANADLPGRVAGIERVVRHELARLEPRVPLRGRGALWVLELPDAKRLAELVERIYARGVAVGYAGRWLRLLPAATIAPERLAEALRTVAAEIQGSLAETG